MSAENSPMIAVHWRLRKERLGLVGSNCQACKTKHFPMRTICPDCEHNNNDPVPEGVGLISNIVEGETGQGNI